MRLTEKVYRWTNPQKFLDLALSRYLYQFNSQAQTDQFIFFDRGIIDAVQLDFPQPNTFKMLLITLGTIV